MKGKVSRGRALLSPLAVIAASVVLLGWRFARLIWQFSVNVFFYDQWDYVYPFFRGNPRLAELFFMQHGPHREGIGLIADRILYPLTDWNVRAESFLIGGCIFAAMLLAFVLKVKLFGALAYSDVLIPLVFLTPAQYETVIGTPNPAYSGLPLLLIMLYCLAWLIRDAKRRYPLILVINLLLIYTGFGVFMGLVTIGVFLIECWRSRAQPGLPLAGLIVSAASLGSFFIRYRFQPAGDCFEPPKHDLLRYPQFMALMFARFTGLTDSEFHPTVLGAGLLLSLLAIAAVHVCRVVMTSPDINPKAAAASLLTAVPLLYTFLYSANTAIGRVCVGLPGAAYPSRYTTLMIPGFLGIYFGLLSISFPSLRQIALALFSTLVVCGALLFPAPYIHWYADGKRAWANCYLQAGSIQYCDRVTNFNVYPHPDVTGLQQKLDYLKLHHLNLFNASGP